jgi:hypothetical protein
VRSHRRLHPDFSSKLNLERCRRAARTAPGRRRPSRGWHISDLRYLGADVGVSCCPPPQRHRALDPSPKAAAPHRPPATPAHRRHRGPIGAELDLGEGRAELRGRRVEEVVPAKPPVGLDATLCGCPCRRRLLCPWRRSVWRFCLVQPSLKPTEDFYHGFTSWNFFIIM